MNAIGAFIVAGYLGLIVLWGWPGLIAGAIHAAILLLAIKRK